MFNALDFIEYEFNPQEIKSKINLKTNNWVTNELTNCYAFALGLDLKPSEICRYADAHLYCGGRFFLLQNHLLNDDGTLEKMSYQEKFELDFQSLELFYEEIELYDKIVDANEWKIAYFENEKEKGFHFYRQAENGIWYHKPGFYFEKPTCYTEKKFLINDPIQGALVDYPDYTYKRTYRLRK